MTDAYLRVNPVTQKIPSVYLVEQVLYEVVWGFKTQRIAAKVQKRAHHITFLIKNRSLVQKQFYVRQNNVQSILWQLAMSLVA